VGSFRVGGRETAGIRFSPVRRISKRLRTLSYPLAVTAAAPGGALVTAREREGWYADLRKPRWTAPPSAFAPVWTALYAQMTPSAWLVDRTDGARDRTRALALWWLQLGLNAAWSPGFFARRDRVGAALYLPYLARGAYAAVLNAQGRARLYARRHAGCVLHQRPEPLAAQGALVARRSARARPALNGGNEVATRRDDPSRDGRRRCFSTHNRRS
jgi:tryptophan-rich sensory protein